MMSGAELAFHRRATLAFIDASPYFVTLIPRVATHSATGVTYSDEPPRPQQRGRLIEVNATSGPDRGDDGSQEKDFFELLLPWDSIVRQRDYWIGLGLRHEVTGILPFNGYEIRAEVTRFGQEG